MNTKPCGQNTRCCVFQTKYTGRRLCLHFFDSTKPPNYDGYKTVEETNEIFAQNKLYGVSLGTASLFIQAWFCKMNLLLTHAMSMENDMDNIKKKANLIDAEITRQSAYWKKQHSIPSGMLRKMYQRQTRNAYTLTGI